MGYWPENWGRWGSCLYQEPESKPLHGRAGQQQPRVLLARNRRARKVVQRQHSLVNLISSATGFMRIQVFAWRQRKVSLAGLRSLTSQKRPHAHPQACFQSLGRVTTRVSCSRSDLSRNAPKVPNILIPSKMCPNSSTAGDYVVRHSTSVPNVLIISALAADGSVKHARIDSFQQQFHVGSAKVASWSELVDLLTSKQMQLVDGPFPMLRRIQFLDDDTTA